MPALYWCELPGVVPSYPEAIPVSAARPFSRLVFTDLDGTLLDHHDYSYGPALDRIRELQRLGIPLIIASSKTRAEIEPLRLELGNRHPFICENGAAVFIPLDYFSAQPAGTSLQGDYWLREFSAPRSTWLALLQQLQAEFADQFTSFHQLDAAGISRVTGLSQGAAELANQREYSEPVQWLGTQQERDAFTSRLGAAGASVLQGGRFLGVAGDCDKGRALVWLRDCYASQRGGPVNDLAAGDSDNDVAMLEAAASALLVRSPVHEFPQLARSEAVLRTTQTGPAGWSEGVAAWLHHSGLKQTT